MNNEPPAEEFQSETFTPQEPAAARQKPHKKLIIAGLILLLIAGAAAAKLLLNGPAGSPPPAVKTTVKNQASAPARIRLIATGDFIAHDTLNERAKNSDGSYNYLQFMSDFKPVFSAADIKFCNQATISAGAEYGISGYPVFNAPAQFAKDMAGLGCNLINTASNHSFDKGQAAINATLKVWDGIPGLLAVAGENRSETDKNTIRYFEVKGLKFAFLAYTTYSNTTPPNDYGVNKFSRGLAQNQIQSAKQSGAKFIIISMRWGTEYSSDVNAEQATDSQFLADQGANLILGHGPHQLQTVKRLGGGGGNQTLVWYSLGNFINTQEPAETLFNGLAVIDIDPAAVKVSSAKFLPIYMHYEWSAAQKAADNLLARKNLQLYLLDDATQALIDENQLNTTVAAQKARMDKLINANTDIPLITKSQYFQ